MMLTSKWRRCCDGSRLLAWLTIAIPAIWLLVTILSLLGKWMHFDAGIAQWLTLPSAFSTFLSRPWTLLTYMWIHFDVLHMLFNVLWLYWFGRFLLISDSDRRLALHFLGGGICGGLAFLASAATGISHGWLCGCSAAVIAVMCGAAVKHPDLEIRLFLIGNVRLKWVAAACCLLTFIGGGGNHAAHFGGLLWGVAVSLIKIPDISSIPAAKRTRRPDKMVRILNDRRNDLERLDELLDKIKLSGYGSLSRRERKELNDLSSRLKS